MSLEGRLRDLALAEVLQLLTLGRKTGTLRLRSTLAARNASIVVDAGCVVNAEDFANTGSGRGEDQRSVSDRVLDLLQWTDGDFRFTPHDVDARASSVRIPTDVLLMESARRADAWLAFGDSIPGPHAVPSFLDVQPAQLPLLHLAPDQWEVLTRIDGMRSVSGIAEDLGRDMVDVARTLHDLIEAGVLTFGSATPEQATPTLPTPPSMAAITPPIAAPVIPPVIPPVYSPVMPFALPFEFGDDDSLFDPMQVGVMTPDGMPATMQHEERANNVSHAAPSVTGAFVYGRVGTERAETSGRESLDATAREMLISGDGAAATGSLSQACALWEQALAMSDTHDAREAVRERIMLARRLMALMHPSTRN